MEDTLSHPSEILRQGIRACRQGKWREGFDYLTSVVHRSESEARLPALYYSYLGQAMARCEGRKRDGLELCRHALELDAYQPEIHLNLAHTYIMIGNRWAAFRSLQDGLALDPSHARLNELHESLGVRRRPVLSFLDRGNPVNQVLGRLTYALSRKNGHADEDLDEDDD